MYAVVEISGKQFKVKEKQSILVDKLNKDQGENIELHDVYLLDDGKKVLVGTPNITNVSIRAKVLGHQKGDKVIVFKKKRRKGFATKNGHRQQHTRLLIEKINSNSVISESSGAVKTEKVEADLSLLTKQSQASPSNPVVASSDDTEDKSSGNTKFDSNSN